MAGEETAERIVDEINDASIPGAGRGSAGHDQVGDGVDLSRFGGAKRLESSGRCCGVMGCMTRMLGGDRDLRSIHRNPGCAGQVANRRQELATRGDWSFHEPLQNLAGKQPD